MGIGSILVTGDSRLRADRLPIQESFCRLTPEQKVDVVRGNRQQGRHVLFVGDGIEWPPPVLSALPQAIALSRATVRLIRSNLLIALSYNMVGSR
jgi:cation transport ATPase